jgi:predicted dehydrogenase
MLSQIYFSRRRFLTAASASLAVPVLTTNLVRVTRATPNERITVAMIGCGKMAKDYHLPELLRQPDVQLVAVCDVDTTRREAAQHRVNEHYSTDKQDFAGCDTYDDFRRIIERDDIDAVCIATPDHWHALQIIEACKSGKDVYCEKPLTLTLAEAQRCVEAARKHERIVQTGSQQRSNVFGPFRQAVEIIRSGRLGKIHKVTVGVGGPSVWCNLDGEEIEPGLNWDLWLGPAPMRDYHSILSPRGVHNHFPAWREYREYSGGGHTDMGAHHYDIAHWALDLDQSGPVRVIPPAVPQATSGVRYLYADGLEIVHGGPGGCEFHGENGTLRIDRGHLSSDPGTIVETPLESGEVRLPESPGHHRNWLDCIKSRELPIADVEKGARTVSVIHLGNLAYWNRTEIGWDPATWKFTDPAHQPWLDYERRDPWQLPQL